MQLNNAQLGEIANTTIVAKTTMDGAGCNGSPNAVEQQAPTRSAVFAHTSRNNRSM